MLQLTNIKKSYKTANFTQTALDGVTIAFRDNEFAAVLGPSGSGKTTMLNIIGGLDHYDSGDLEIDGVSTKKYKDKDWDTYRNNRIGFVFQNYNLISHQTILSNVELALTLSGVSKTERRERAKQALAEVGLAEHVNKRPSQLSGGQMQRVAIARALINDPEILLADEPTGALDTKTGDQVMDLLTKIAKKRLVIMVTHNNELAEQYATRIIHLTDGEIISDSHPFNPDENTERPEREPRKASMSFLTAIALSFSNLMTKKGRTFVTSLAGSIGIIGIAAILALANGINAYIQNVERDTMSIYPIAIQQSGFDLGSMFDDSGGSARPEQGTDSSDGARVMNVIKTMFSLQNKNDIASLKKHIDASESTLDPYVNAVQYLYDITPQIYLADTSRGAEQVNPDAIFSSYGMGSTGSMNSMSSLASSFGAGGMNVFHEMPGELDMFENQYEVVAGHWPQKYDEAILVLSSNGGVTDYTLYGMGLRDRSKLAAMVESMMNNTQTNVEIGDDESSSLSYDTLMSAKFKVINPADQYQYDERYDVWVDKSGDKEYMRSLVDSGSALNIVGIVKPYPDVTATSLSTGINYTPELVSHLLEEAAKTKVVQSQLASPDKNVLTGKTFEQERQEAADSTFSFNDLISIDEEGISKAFKFDTSALQLDSLNFGGSSLNMEGLDLSGVDLSGMQLPALDLSGMDLSGVDLSGVEMPDFDLPALTEAIADSIDVPPEAIAGIMTGILQDFLSEIDLTDPNLDLAAAFADYIAREDVQAKINEQLAGLIDPTVVQQQINDAVQKYMEEVMQAYMAQISGALQTTIQTAMETYMGQVMNMVQTQLMTQMQTLMESQIMPQLQSQIEQAMVQLPGQLQNAISIDQDAFAQAFQLNMGEDEILDLMTTLMNPQESTFERNLSILGYADPANPSQINIYPIDFAAKAEIESFLQTYNDRMESDGQPDKVVRYTDIVGTIMSSVTDIVNMISYALIAFVAISLVVSSIMIGVITYISVLERKKEIGILRAIGASKRDIRRVFNAETLIVGFVAGILGILATLLLCIPANIIVANNFGVEQIAQLPLWAAFFLIGVSMLLAFIAGLFPSSAAARRDPVVALRSE